MKEQRLTKIERWICYEIILEEYEVNYLNIRKSGGRKVTRWIL